MSSRRIDEPPWFDIELLTELLDRFEAAEPPHEIAIQAVKELLAEAREQQRAFRTVARSNRHRN